EADDSFHELALRWMLGVTAAAGQEGLAKKFFDYLEANAEDYWQVPALEFVEGRGEAADDEGEENLYGAAYADVTYQDSTDDDQEGAVAEGGPYQGEFDLELEVERIEKRLQFLSTVARLWQIAAPEVAAAGRQGAGDLAGWLATARAHYDQLLGLLDAIAEHKVPDPIGSYDSLVEYDRRRVIKEQLLYIAIGTCLDTFLAVGTLQAN